MASCDILSKGKKDQAVAECYGKYLYQEDLAGLVPEGTNPDDSIVMTRQFINNWIMQQIMLKQAEDNLTNDQKDFNDQIESYRNSLIIFAYESELIRQKLDTIISPSEIEEFYHKNQENFQLRENIVQVNYLKIPRTNANKELERKSIKLIKSGGEDDLQELADICNRSMWQCYFHNGEWMKFDDLLTTIPIQTDDQERFLQNKTFYEMQDSTYHYMLNFDNIKTKEAVSPLSFETANIHSMILNKRKIELMDRMQKEVFDKALADKEFTIY